MYSIIVLMNTYLIQIKFTDGGMLEDEYESRSSFDAVRFALEEAELQEDTNIANIKVHRIK